MTSYLHHYQNPSLLSPPAVILRLSRHYFSRLPRISCEGGARVVAVWLRLRRTPIRACIGFSMVFFTSLFLALILSLFFPSLYFFFFFYTARPSIALFLIGFMHSLPNETVPCPLQFPGLSEPARIISTEACNRALQK